MAAKRRATGGGNGGSARRLAAYRAKRDFEKSPEPTGAKKVKAPLVAECYGNFEGKLADAKLVGRYSLFIFEVVYAHVATSPKYPTTVHYRGDGVFMISGRNLSRRRLFKPEML